MHTTEANNDTQFGLRFYEELRSRGFLHRITNRFDYDGIQRLKRANREEVVMMFVGLGYPIVRKLKIASPREIVDLMALQAEAQARHTPMMFMMM